MIKAGIIGTGVGLKHFEAINNYRGSRVVCILEKNQKRISKLKKKIKNVDFLNSEKKFFNRKDINFISIASYDEYHFSQIVKAAERKSNILVEKPICLNFKELQKINSLIRRKKVNFTSNLVLRKNSLFENLRKKLKKNNIYYIEANYFWGRKEKLFKWRSKTKQYSLTLGAAIHMLDLVCWFLNSRPISVFSKSSNKVTNRTKFKKFSFATYLFTFPNNVLVKISADGVCIHPHFHTVKIYEKDQTFISDISGQFHIKKINKKLNIKKMNFEYPDKKNRKNLIRGFIDSILDGKSIQPSIKSLIDLTTACLFADKSLNEKKELKIKYLK